MEELQDAVASSKFRQKLKLDEIQAAIATNSSVDNLPLFFPSFLSALETPELKRDCLHRMCKMRKNKLTETSIWGAVVSSCIGDDPKIVDQFLNIIELATYKKKIKDISTELLKGEIERIADNYIIYAGWFRE